MTSTNPMTLRIELSGPSGSGKTTMRKALTKWLVDKGIPLKVGLQANWIVDGKELTHDLEGNIGLEGYIQEVFLTERNTSYISFSRSGFGKWVSVTERMPTRQDLNADGEALVCWGYGDGKLEMALAAPTRAGEWFESRSELLTALPNVTHWCRVPAYPEDAEAWTTNRRQP